VIELSALQAAASRYVYYGAYLRWRMRAMVAADEALQQDAGRSSAEIDALQAEKLRALIRHAHDTVPYYRGVFAERGLRPEDIRTPADLEKLPVLTKAIIQEQGASLRSSALPPDHGEVFVNHTGGSTGQPLTFYQDERYRTLANANLNRSLEWCGWFAGARTAHLWGADVDATRRRGLRGKVLNWMRNELFLNTFGASPNELAAFTGELRRFRPDFIVGYVSSLTTLALLLRERGIDDIRPRAIQSSAETLTEKQRRLIEETLHAPMFDRYGCREMGNIAHECSAHQGLHIFTDLHVVEVVRDGEPAPAGETGALILTNLDNYAMPFIRYAVGDVGVWSDRICSCGRPFPLLEKVQGRTADVITSPAGRLIHGEFFTHLFYGVEGVRQFQVVQDTREHLQIRIIAEPGFDPAAVARLERTILEHGDPAFRIDTELVDHIDQAASGKLRFTISHVPLSFAKSGD
jgi:phenylacetate-CoA ligase